MNNYERGEADALHRTMEPLMALLERLADARRDSAEWKEQHENLLAMFRASENRAAKAEEELRLRPEARQTWEQCESPVKGISGFRYAEDSEMEDDAYHYRHRVDGWFRLAKLPLPELPPSGPSVP